MKANELRIGNYINHEGEGIEVRGIEMPDGYVYYDGAERPENIEECSAIPLTEEWLLKFGFEKKWDDYLGEVAQFEKGILTWSNGNFRIGSYWTNDFEINYVHQLQNLYFALTGDELTLICTS